MKQSISRRTALRYLAVTAASAPFVGVADVGASTSKSGAGRPLLGLDAHSLRAMKWKAMRHIEYAGQLGLDAVLLNGPQYFDSLDAGHLKRVKALAESKGVRIYVGAGGVSRRAKSFKGAFGSPEEVLAQGIRVAAALGCSSVNCRIGNIDDRYAEGGIDRHLDAVASTMRAVRSRAEDAGVKFAFENHAGDTRSEEVLSLIDAVGSDLCGVMLDPGNALWAMEDPMEQLRVLGSHVLCMSVRDYMVWETEEGATFQWTAIGEGLMDVPAYVRLLQEKCPEVPIFVETISNSQRPIPFLKEDYWKGFANVKAEGIIDFLALCRRGRPLQTLVPAVGEDAKTFEKRHQQSEFEKSIRYLRALEI